MKRLFLLPLLMAATVCLSLVAGVVAQRSGGSSKEPAADTQWEYLVVAGGTVNLSSSGADSRMRKQPDESFAQEAYALERNFDKLGQQGWQLVTVHGAPNNPVYYFKRLKAGH